LRIDNPLQFVICVALPTGHQSVGTGRLEYAGRSARRLGGRTATVDPTTLESSLGAAKRFRVEIDAMPGGYVCPASYWRSLAPDNLRSVVERRRPVSDLLSPKQRGILRDHLPGCLSPDDLTVPGPVHVMKLKAAPRGLQPPYVVELWMFPDGSRSLELATRCKPQTFFGIATKASQRRPCLLTSSLGGQDPDVHLRRSCKNTLGCRTDLRN
jgi:hypothetical protein